ncbi:MAG: AMP-binding protein [Pseudomonadota bacterium]
MPRLHDWALEQPDKVAFHIAETGEAITYRELDERADRVASWLVSLGLKTGDTLALLLENHARTFELWWGARRAGVYYVPISTHLKAGEVSYIVRDCGARVFITSHTMHELAGQVKDELAEHEAPHRFMLDGTIAGFSAYEQAVDSAPVVSLPERPLGREFMYSSGTTGFPKGIRRAQVPYAQRYALAPLELQLRSIFRFERDSIFLSPSPLYHATARFNIRTIECGGTCVILGKYDAEAALTAIERYRVTHSHWVPTMFVRMLALPPDTRQRFDVSSMQCAIHAAAPCPMHVKDAMIDWWGPVIEEYYGGSENLGVTYLNAQEWLAHRGSVGKTICGELHIMADDDPERELPAGEIGMIYFAGGVPFQYHSDEGKTRSVFNSRGWGTYGDLGHIDADGYLYMSDRRTDLIITGGVNIYPREVELVLGEHPAVAEAAVIAIPNEAFGQEVKAVVELKEPDNAGPALAAELMQWCADRMSRMKCPRSVDFEVALPRSDNGKLLKRVLRERYQK